MENEYSNEVPHPFLKPGAEVIMYTDQVKKLMTQNEVSAYALLNRFADTLHDDEITIRIPELLEYDSTTRQSTLTRIGTFRQFSPLDYFGMSDVYTKDYLRTMLDVFALMRARIPAADVKDATDYEQRKADGSISSLEYLRGGYYADLPDYFADLRHSIERYVDGSQPYIEEMEQFAAHRDPNPNNYNVLHGKPSEVAIVDWETFGLARVGYDEGRLMTYLALDEEKQSNYVTLVESRFTPEEMVYFWRIALMRSYREMTSIYGGHYDTRLGDENVPEYKVKMIDALHGIALRSQRSLDKYLTL